MFVCVCMYEREEYIQNESMDGKTFFLYFTITAAKW